MADATIRYLRHEYDHSHHCGGRSRTQPQTSRLHSAIRTDATSFCVKAIPNKLEPARPRVLYAIQRQEPVPYHNHESSGQHIVALLAPAKQPVLAIPLALEHKSFLVVDRRQRGPTVQQRARQPAKCGGFPAQLQPYKTTEHAIR